MFEPPPQEKQSSTSTSVWIGVIVVVIVVAAAMLFMMTMKGPGTPASNRSPYYSYSNIAYETSYLNADGKVIASNKGTLPLSLGPAGEKNTQLRDLTYPNGTASYKIRVTSATSQAE